MIKLCQQLPDSPTILYAPVVANHLFPSSDRRLDLCAPNVAGTITVNVGFVIVHKTSPEQTDMLQVILPRYPRSFCFGTPDN
jgi:hypothetical protein